MKQSHTLSSLSITAVVKRYSFIANHYTRPKNWPIMHCTQPLTPPVVTVCTTSRRGKSVYVADTVH